MHNFLIFLYYTNKVLQLSAVFFSFIQNDRSKYKKQGIIFVTIRRHDKLTRITMNAIFLC